LQTALDGVIRRCFSLLSFVHVSYGDVQFCKRAVLSAQWGIRMSVYWVVLSIAVVTEVMWALSLKAVQQNPGAFTIGSCLVLTALNVGLLSFALRGIPVGTAYAVWTGLGAVGVVVAGIMLHQDPLTIRRIAFMALIVCGVIGLKLET
jgi:quaternary ammonium compound-resistance protein SugE